MSQLRRCCLVVTSFFTSVLADDLVKFLEFEELEKLSKFGHISNQAPSHQRSRWSELSCFVRFSVFRRRSTIWQTRSTDHKKCANRSLHSFFASVAQIWIIIVLDDWNSGEAFGQERRFVASVASIRFAVALEAGFGDIS